MSDHSRLLDSLKPPEIREAALAEITGRGHSDVEYGLIVAVARRCDSDNANTGAVPRWDALAIQQKFAGKVSRAMEKLVSEGLIRKSGPKDARPDGSQHRYVTYWTHDAWKAAEEKAREHADAARALAQRWDSIEDRLKNATGLNLDAGRVTGTRKLDAAEWEWLLDRAGW